MSNKVYDAIKWTLLVAVAPTIALITGLGELYGFDTTVIVGTISLFATLHRHFLVRLVLRVNLKCRFTGCLNFVVAQALFAFRRQSFTPNFCHFNALGQNVLHVQNLLCRS
jgi:hypothetical protein